jgi:glyoxylase-like metal-dependent hydrolase (beta-lactamase superfamily II)
VLLPSENPMTLGGTNAYLISVAGSSEVVIVDPGDEDITPIIRQLGKRRCVLVLLTHRHGDHSRGIDALIGDARTPVRAWDLELVRHAEGLRDNDAIVVGPGPAIIKVLHTPGHTSDSVCFVINEALGGPLILTGDTLLGRGSTSIGYPDGGLAEYFASLDRLMGLGDLRMLPGHGAQRESVRDAATEVTERRLERLEQLKLLLTRELAAANVAEITQHLYSDKLHPRVRRAARLTVLAQLDYLGDERSNEPLDVEDCER